MTSLPNQVNFATAAGSQWAQTFQFTGVDLTGLSWEFVIRPNVNDTAQPPLVKVTTTVSAQGQITVNTTTGTVQVVLTPAATSLLGMGARPYALWSNPGTTTATTWCDGTFNTQLAPAP
ncbi:hypothetical protein AB0D11_02570 [Streptomyces monashensis]|uniref:hypothetical protein n=1 Tax=Streptomyces monashensis TaxID=1678012 RepID=UPI0033E05078